MYKFYTKTTVQMVFPTFCEISTPKKNISRLSRFLSTRFARRAPPPSAHLWLRHCSSANTHLCQRVVESSDRIDMYTSMHYDPRLHVK